MPATKTLTYAVPDMSCDHCIAAITGEVQQLAGVTDVSIDLATKLVSVTGVDLQDDAIREAITEAGFEAV